MDVTEEHYGWKVKLIILRGEGSQGMWFIYLFISIIVMVGSVDNWHRSMFFYIIFYIGVQSQAPYNDAEC